MPPLQICIGPTIRIGQESMRDFFLSFSLKAHPIFLFEVTKGKIELYSWKRKHFILQCTLYTVPAVVCVTIAGIVSIVILVLFMRVV